MTGPLASPAYALAPASFPFPALAALAGRAPNETREAVLACVMVARLGWALTEPTQLPPELLRERAEAARAWLAGHQLAPEIRAPLMRAINATGNGHPLAVAAETEAVAAALSPVLDARCTKELERLVTRLRESGLH